MVRCCEEVVVRVYQVRGRSLDLGLVQIRRVLVVRLRMVEVFVSYGDGGRNLAVGEVLVLEILMEVRVLMNVVVKSVEEEQLVLEVLLAR